MEPLVVLLVTVVALTGGAAIGYLVAHHRAAASARDTETRLAETRTELAAVRAELAAERRAGEQRLAALQADHARAAEQFKALAADALKANSEQFMLVAEERLKRSQQASSAELAQREAAVKQLVEPLSKTLEQVKAELSAAERARVATHSALGEQVRAMRETSEALRTETSQLVTALRSSQVRGKWGEVQLRRVVELAGMLEHVDFVEQSTVQTDDGRLRPDMVVHIAGGKNVVVDAKVAFLAYLDAMQATDEDVRAERLAAHARHMKKHVDDLAAKQYWEQFSPAPEFVVMFVPAEPFLHAALETDPGLYEYAMSRNVVLASPMTLVGLLRTIAYGWRQDALAANAQQVLTLGRELHGRLATMGNHLAKLGRAIETSAGAYNQAISSLEKRVLVSARRFADLKVVDEELETPAPARLELTNLSAPELVASQTEAFVAIEDIEPTSPPDPPSDQASADGPATSSAAAH